MVKCNTKQCKTHASVTHKKIHYCSMCYIKFMGLTDEYLEAISDAKIQTESFYNQTYDVPDSTNHKVKAAA